MAETPHTTPAPPGASPYALSPIARRTDQLLLAMSALLAAELGMDALPDDVEVPDAQLLDAEFTQDVLIDCILAIQDEPVRQPEDALLKDFAGILEGWRDATDPESHVQLRTDLVRMAGLRCPDKGPVALRVNRQLRQGRRLMGALMGTDIHRQTGHLHAPDLLMRRKPRPS